MNASRWLNRILFGEFPRRTLIRASILAVSCFIIFKFLLLPVRIEGKSMEPTYRDGGFTFLNTFRYRFRDPVRGDIVGIRMAGRRVMLFKRVIGLPGEHLCFKNGALIINERYVPEEYLKMPCYWNMPEVEIGPGEFFVVGDNRTGPIEFQAKGRIDRSKIIGGPLF